VGGEPTDAAEAEVLGWIREVLGTEVTQPRLHLAGGSRQTYFLDTAAAAAAPRALVLRRDSGDGPLAGSPFTLGREATVYEALRGTGVPVPRLLGISADGQAVVMERAAGGPDIARLEPGMQREVFTGFVQAIGLLHTLDTRTLSLPGFRRPRTPQEHALLDLQDWSLLAGKPPARGEPLIAYALSWLRRNAPGDVERTSLVQGDCGPGNFLADGGRLSAIIDWELAHLGDPHDDLAWIEARTDGQPIYGFSDPSALHAAYESTTGTVVDPARLGYYRVFVALRCAVMPALMAATGGPLGVTGYVMALHRWLTRLGYTLAAAAGITLDEISEPTGVASPHELMYQSAIAGIRQDLLPGAASRQSRLNAKEALRLLRYLRARDQHAAEFAAAELADGRRYLGIGEVPDDDYLRAAAARAGLDGDEAMLRFLTRRSERCNFLWRTKS